MTEKQKYALDKVIAALPENLQGMYREIAEYAIVLGYMPTIKGPRESYADFVKNKVRKTILKIDTDPKFPPRLAVRFFALPTYSAFFQAAIEERVLPLLSGGYEARCYGCGKCDGTHGYTFTLPDGKKAFWCGRDVVPLPPFSAENVPEIKAALQVQDEFFMKRIL